MGSSEFASEKDAISFIEGKTNRSRIFQINSEKLEESLKTCPYIPCVDKDGTLRLFCKRFNNFDQGEGFEDLLGREHLTYLEEEVEIINSDRFIHSFIQNASEICIEVSDLNSLIHAINFHLLEVDVAYGQIHENYENVFLALGKMRYSPVYIYN